MRSEGNYVDALTELGYVSELFSSYETDEHSYEEERARTYQLIYGCLSKLNKQQETVKWCAYFEPKLKYFRNHQNFEDVLWIVVETTLKEADTQNRETLMHMISTIPTR
jgi:hypothetical protein